MKPQSNKTLADRLVHAALAVLKGMADEAAANPDSASIPPVLPATYAYMEQHGIEDSKEAPSRLQIDIIAPETKSEWLERIAEGQRKKHIRVTEEEVASVLTAAGVLVMSNGKDYLDFQRLLSVVNEGVPPAAVPAKVTVAPRAFIPQLAIQSEKSFHMVALKIVEVLTQMAFEADANAHSPDWPPLPNAYAFLTKHGAEAGEAERDKVRKVQQDLSLAPDTKREMLRRAAEEIRYVSSMQPVTEEQLEQALRGADVIVPITGTQERFNFPLLWQIAHPTIGVALQKKNDGRHGQQGLRS